MIIKTTISISLISIVILLLLSIAQATETFDCSVNNHKWEIMAHYSVDNNEVRDIMLFISENEQYVYYPKHGQAKFNKRARLFTANVANKEDGFPDLKINVTGNSGKMSFKSHKYSIKCKWETQ